MVAVEKYNIGCRGSRATVGAIVCRGSCRDCRAAVGISCRVWVSDCRARCSAGCCPRARRGTACLPPALPSGSTSAPNNLVERVRRTRHSNPPTTRTTRSAVIDFPRVGGLWSQQRPVNFRSLISAQDATGAQDALADCHPCPPKQGKRRPREKGDGALLSEPRAAPQLDPPPLLVAAHARRRALLRRRGQDSPPAPHQPC